MKVKPFGLIGTFAIVTLSLGLVNHVIIGSLLLEEAGRDAWMSIIISITIVFPWITFPLFGILKKMKQKRMDKWLSERLHPVIVWIIMSYFMIVFMIIAVETIVITSSWAGTSYLPRTPFLAIIIILLCLCLYAASKGMRTIAYISCLLVPMVVLLGDFVMSVNMPKKDYHYLLPMLEHGTSPVIAASFNCLTAFSEMFILLFIQHHMKTSMKRWHIILLVLFLALLAMGPIIAAIAEFGPAEAAKMRYPAFSQWRLVTIGKYFEHVDFFAIFQWLSGALVRISFSIYILIEFSPINRMKHKWIGYLIVALLLIILANYWTKHMTIYQVVLEWYFRYIGIITISMVLFIYGTSFLKKRRGKDGQKNGPRATNEGQS